ncbi:T-cell surface glycoprotein CD4 [Psammomys obesus]|uniref:T-cell surface glycoprotein CD4 n=1 Tax=Psammomys obesus TaxID=48139 RepID=UPI002452914F|nr:T-cell surface glycoprotein CD4 [Psammomys obesus]
MVKTARIPTAQTPAPEYPVLPPTEPPTLDLFQAPVCKAPGPHADAPVQQAERRTGQRLRSLGTQARLPQQGHRVLSQEMSFRHLLLVLQLSQLLAVTQGKTVVVAREGDSATLPCGNSQKAIAYFTWKLPDQTMILRNPRYFLTKVPDQRFSRFNSRTGEWDRGSFPLIIDNVKMEDSQSYICEVDNKKMEVELRVFRVTINPSTRLLEGQSLNVILEYNHPVDNPSIQCKGPRGGSVKRATAIFSVPNLRTQDSGQWACTVTLNQVERTLAIKILVLGFKKASITAYKSEGESAEFSFPLDIEENARGELRWKAEEASFFQHWATFSVQNKEVSVQKATDDLKLHMEKTLPISLKIAQVSLQCAGTGNLTLTLDQGTLYQEVNLVVMKVAQDDDSLTCEVRGPVSSNMRLTLKREDQEPRVSKEQKVVQVPAPEAGVWHCLLSDGEEIKIDSKIQVSPRGWNHDHPKFLAVVSGGICGFLAFIGLIIWCVRCRRQQRQAARMSQIKRLLSEKKTCRCPHRMQKTQHLI